MNARPLAAYLVVFMGSAVLVLGAMQIRMYLREPFASNEKSFKEQDQALNQVLANTPSLFEVDDLRLLDTDKDGLSDYDELNFYHTSPYLDDTDSDGYSDKDEIDNLDDPNCPKGYICDNMMDDAELDMPTDSEPGSGAGIIRQSGTEPAAPQGTGASADFEEETQYKEIYSYPEEQPENYIPEITNLNQPTSSGAEQAKKELGALDELSMFDVRALLIERGVEEALLADFTDQELQQMLDEVIAAEKDSLGVDQ